MFSCAQSKETADLSDTIPRGPAVNELKMFIVCTSQALLAEELGKEDSEEIHKLQESLESN